MAEMENQASQNEEIINQLQRKSRVVNMRDRMENEVTHSQRKLEATGKSD